MRRPAPSGFRAAAFGLGILVAVFALYAPALRFDFINLDDMHYTVDNPVVTGGFSMEAVQAAWTTAPADCWAPLLWLSFMLDVELFGLVPWAFHLHNILLFVLSAGLLFGLVRRWTGRTGLAAAVALLWAFHPARVESVAWVVERKDVLSGFFFLLCLGAYVRSREGDRMRSGWDWAATGFLALGMLAKPVLVMVPFVLLLLDFWPLGRLSGTGGGLRRLPQLVLEKWRFGLVAFGLGAVAWLAGPDTPQPPWNYRLATIPINYLVYLRQAVWPQGLSVLCPRPVFSCGALALALAVLGGLTAWVWHLRRKFPAVPAGWLWFGVMFVPSIGFFWFGTTEGNGVRFSYLPHMGLMLAAAVAADGILRTRGWHGRGGAVLCLLVLATWGAGTARLLPCWRSNRTIYARVLQVNPNSAHAFEGLGNACFEDGRLAEWQQFLEEFRRKWAGNPVVNIHYAWWLAAVLGETEAGVEVLEHLSGRESSRPDFWTWMDDKTNGEQLLGSWRDTAGICLRSRNDLERMAVLRAGWEGRWDDRTRNLFLGEMLLAYWAAGRDAEAAALALELHESAAPPDLAGNILARLLARWQQGGRGYAFAGFRLYAARRPDDGLALNNIAWLVATAAPDGLHHAHQDEWPAAALAWAERARELGGSVLPGVWDTVAAARANAGDFPGAVAAAGQALDLARRVGEQTLADQIQVRLDGFRAGQPWREPGDAARNLKTRR